MSWVGFHASPEDNVLCCFFIFELFGNVSHGKKHAMFSPVSTFSCRMTALKVHISNCLENILLHTTPPVNCEMQKTTKLFFFAPVPQ